IGRGLSLASSASLDRRGCPMRRSFRSSTTLRSSSPSCCPEAMADYYEVLSLGRTASEDEIKGAYRKLAMRWHPDRNNGSKESEERFKSLTEAYDVLRDPQKRAVYDRYGETGLRGGGGGAAYHHIDLSEALNVFMRDFGLGGFDGIFGANARQGGSVRTG